MAKKERTMEEVYQVKENLAMKSFAYSIGVRKIIRDFRSYPIGGGRVVFFRRRCEDWRRGR